MADPVLPVSDFPVFVSFAAPLIESQWQLFDPCSVKGCEFKALYATGKCIPHTDGKPQAFLKPLRKKKNERH